MNMDEVKQMALTLLALGLFAIFAERIPLFGKLPGDFRFSYKTVVIYLPVASCLATAGMLSMLWLLMGKK